MSLISCNKSQINEEYSLEAALEVYIDMEFNYNGDYFPTKFTWEEVDACMQQSKYADIINDVEQELLAAGTDDVMDKTQEINYAISFDYVYRPVF